MSSADWKGLILAGGFGTRLNTLGETLPKGLIPADSTTLVGRVIHDWQQALADYPLAIVANGRFTPHYQQWLKEQGLTKTVTLLNDEAMVPERRLGALGDLELALNRLGWWQSTVVVMPSDTYYQFPLADLIAMAKEHDGLITVVKRSPQPETEIAGRLGCAVMEGTRIVAFVEKPPIPPSPFAAIPIYIYPAAVLSLLPLYRQAGGNMDTPGSIIPWLLARGLPVHALVTEGTTLDVGTVADVARLKNIARLVE